MYRICFRMIQWEGMGAEVNDGEICMTCMCNLIILVLYIFKIFHNEKFENSRKKKRERKKGKGEGRMEGRNHMNHTKSGVNIPCQQALTT